MSDTKIFLLDEHHKKFCYDFFFNFKFVIQIEIKKRRQDDNKRLNGGRGLQLQLGFLFNLLHITKKK